MMLQLSDKTRTDEPTKKLFESNMKELNVSLFFFLVFLLFAQSAVLIGKTAQQQQQLLELRRATIQRYSVSPDIEQLAAQCLSLAPEERPSFETICGTMTPFCKWPEPVLPASPPASSANGKVNCKLSCPLFPSFDAGRKAR